MYKTRLLAMLFNNIENLVIWFCVFFLYTYTAPPSIFLGDSGDMTAAAGLFGVAHDPGYPLYSLLGYIWIKVFSFGTIAWRMNVFSAIWAAGGVVMLYMIVKCITKNVLGALVAALVLAFSSTYWLFGNTAEVFSLHTFIALGFFYMIVLFYVEKKVEYFYAAAAFFSLGIAHHHTIILWLPGAVLLMVFARFWKYLSVKQLLLGCGIAASGFLWYLYLPLSQILSGQYYWNDGSSLQGIIDIFLRKSYGTFDIQVGGAALETIERIDYLPVYTLLLLYNFSILGGVLGIIGMLKGLVKKQAIAFSLILNFLVSGLLFLTYAGMQLSGLFRLGMIEKFSVMSFSIFALFIGLGIDWIIKNRITTQVIHWSRSPLTGKLLHVVLLILPIYLFIHHWPFLNLRQYWGGWAVGQDIFLNIPPNAILGVKSDTLAFNSRYFSDVEKYRPDVILTSAPKYSVFPKLTQYVDEHDLKVTKSVDDPFFIQDIMENNIGRVPLFLRNRTETTPEGTFFHPVGMTLELVDEDTFDVSGQINKLKYFLNNSFYLNNVYGTDSTLPAYARSIDKDYAVTLSNIGWFIVAYGNRHEAVPIFELGKKLDPHLVSHYIGLSYILRQDTKCEESLAVLDSYPIKSGSYNYELLYEKKMLFEYCFQNTEQSEQITNLIEEQFGTTK